DRTHPDLDQADVRLGWDYLLADNCYRDSNGHGTAVSGIIGAETNNAEGIAGVCWNIAIIPLLVTYPDGSLFGSDLIYALYDAADVGCKVINMSLGGSVESDAVNTAIQYAWNAGCLLIAASGNSGTNAYHYPASYEHVISVGSVGSTLAYSAFSTFNDKLDVCAPGEGILMTFDDYYSPYSRYVTGSGTSFSAPHVAGIVALAACLDPDLTTEKLELLLSTTSQDLGAAGYDPYYGHGLIDGGQMLACLSPVPTVSYQSHVQNIGWQDWMSNGETSGTSGLAYRLEAMRIILENVSGGVEYRTHVQNIGWMDWVADGALSGTEGQCLRLEAIDIRLTGAAVDQFDIYYRVHAQNIGWMDWAKNGQSAGTAGFAYRLEAIQILLVAKGGAAPGLTAVPFIDKNALPPIIRYQSHVQNIGWQDWMSNGETSGTSGLAYRLEAIRIILENVSGGVEYKTHVQNIGWMDWVADGALSGTEGQCLRLEAIDIRLTGAAADQYDIYYRVHAQNIGWMDWAINGQSAGSAGYAYRLEAIQIVLVAKGSAAPGPTAVPFVQKELS
ncbi:MAG: S8 family serine peptidase, partial [Bacillota bacterium]|nr:S8 family serine peptidase [Bacillota bacterium]